MAVNAEAASARMMAAAYKSLMDMNAVSRSINPDLGFAFDTTRLTWHRAEI
jgi:hypothetical protein